MNITTIITTTIAIFFVTTVAAMADDMWQETPDLSRIETRSTPSPGPRLAAPQTPQVDMWAETPDFTDSRRAADFTTNKMAFRNGQAAPGMYSETPDLNRISRQSQPRRIDMPGMLADQ